MARRKILTDEQIAKLPPRTSAYPDPELAGHYIRARPTGRRVFCVVARDPNGKQIWHTIGDTSTHSVKQAREEAREQIRAIKTGGNRDGVETFEAVASEWIKRHVEKNGLISTNRIRSTVDRNLLPAWSGREFVSIRRGDVTKLLDDVEDKAGPVAADNTLAVIRGLCSWYTTRNEDYASPMVRGMRRSNPKDRARDRILTDDELRAIWKTAAANGTFGAFIRIALLTGQRREKVASMKYADIVDGEWSISSASKREKSTAKTLVLPKAALEIIDAQPRFASNPYVFPGSGNGYMTGMSRRKEIFDRRAGVSGWTIHDLRRTARSLMSRASVRPDISERVLGHAMTGVEGIYDRHSYRDEKAHALRALAGLVETIVNPPADNVRILKNVR